MVSARAVAILGIATFFATPGVAHISYSGRDFGSFTGLAAAIATINDQAITSNYGWADATDGDFGDSHRSRAYRFHLDNAAVITISASANPTATATSLGGLLPGFSVYSGLAHLAPAPGDHDTSAISLAYLATLGGAQPKEGSWLAVGDWKIGNDDGVTFADLSSFMFNGYSVDGTAANFGSAPGITGDGTADGIVTGTFLLGPGDYSFFVGGADYAAQDLANPNRLSPYGVAVSLAVAPVPEPASVLLLAGGLAALAVRRRRAVAA